jgi:DNA-binding transcriptional regulator YdaS (Cro superfamily)
MELTVAQRRQLATDLGLSEQYLYQCLTGRRDMDPVEAVRCERDSGGVLSRFAVCRKRGPEIWPEEYAKRAGLVPPSQSARPGHTDAPPPAAPAPGPIDRRDPGRSNPFPDLDRRAPGGA